MMLNSTQSPTVHKIATGDVYFNEKKTNLSCFFHPIPNNKLLYLQLPPNPNWMTKDREIYGLRTNAKIN